MEKIIKDIEQEMEQTRLEISKSREDMKRSDKDDRQYFLDTLASDKGYLRGLSFALGLLKSSN